MVVAGEDDGCRCGRRRLCLIGDDNLGDAVLFQEFCGIDEVLGVAGNGEEDHGVLRADMAHVVVVDGPADVSEIYGFDSDG